MSGGWLGRLGAAFLTPPTVATPAPDSAEADAAPPAAPRAVAVLARAADAAAAGGAVALGLLGGADAGAALVGLWAPHGLGACVPAPATPGARRLAARLAERGHEARATGRLAIVALDADPATACAEAARATAAARDAPAVTVLAGARDEHVDALLWGHDLVLAATTGAGDVVAALAADGLGPRGRVLVLAPAAPPRALAAAGVALLAPWRGAVEEALR